MNEIKIGFEGKQLEALERRAKAHGRNLSDEVREIVRAELDAAPAAPPMTAEDFRRRAKAIRDMTPRGIVQSDSTLLIREDRDR